MFRNSLTHGRPSNNQRAVSLAAVLAGRRAREVSDELATYRFRLLTTRDLDQTIVQIGRYLGFMDCPQDGAPVWKDRPSAIAFTNEPAKLVDVSGFSDMHYVRGNERAIREVTNILADTQTLVNYLGWRIRRLPREALVVAVEISLDRFRLSTPNIIERLGARQEILSSRAPNDSGIGGLADR
jgi:hypothetical protein